MARIKFSTDSAADIPAALREELSIQVLPFPIAMGEKELNDGFDFTPQEFYEMLLSTCAKHPDKVFIVNEASTLRSHTSPQ